MSSSFNSSSNRSYISSGMEIFKERSSPFERLAFWRHSAEKQRYAPLPFCFPFASRTTSFSGVLITRIISFFVFISRQPTHCLSGIFFPITVHQIPFLLFVCVCFLRRNFLKRILCCFWFFCYLFCLKICCRFACGNFWLFYRCFKVKIFCLIKITKIFSEV